MRVCFHLQVKVDRLEEYKRLHREVWPEVLATLKSAGIRNYSLYQWQEGHEFGVLECDDWAETQRLLGESATMQRWEVFMADYLATPVEQGKGPRLLEEVFRLE